MSKILKNNTGSAVPLSDVGQEVPASGQLVIDPSDYNIFASSGDTIAKLSDGTLTLNNGSVDLLLASAISYLQGGVSHVSVEQNPPFAAKKIGTKKLYNRIHGVSQTLSVGFNVIEFDTPYPEVKFNEIEFLNGEFGDKVNLKVLDDDQGTYSGIPYYPLNQFAFNANVRKDFYNRKCTYDADLYLNMTVYIEYTSVSAKDIYVNFMLHELKV